MRGSRRSRPVFTRRSNPPSYIRLRIACVCECARRWLNSLVNDGPSGAAVGTPRSGSRAGGDSRRKSVEKKRDYEINEINQTNEKIPKVSLVWLISFIS